MPTLNVTRKREPKKTSDRKRPNKTFIQKMVEFRGYMTGNEKTSLATLDVKNVMQRVNNRTLSDDVNDNFDTSQCKELILLMRKFVKDVDKVIKKGII
jgi:hypothetical protein